MNNNFQDWTEVKWDKRGKRQSGESDKTFMANQMRKNNVVSTVKPISANKNQINIVTNIKKIEKEEDTFIHKTVSLNMAKKIAQARCDKKITQKELANILSLPFKTIQEYESGKAIPNHLIINKIEKALGTRVR
jgi:putative transcription factor